MTGRHLEVYIDQGRVGLLSENAGIWSFQYAQSWIEDGFALAPGLPLQTDELVDTGSVRPVQWFFDNLLPEEAARALLLSSELTQPIEFDAWYLLSAFGAESAGALSLLPEGKMLEEGRLQPLANEDLEKRIQAMPRQPLAAKAPKKMSIAGAQQKLLVVMAKDGLLYEPVGSAASTHLLKPNVTSDHYPSSAVNEWFCATLARRLGLNVPEVELRFVPSPVYIIRRFDRDFTADPVGRLHALDAAQLLSLSAGAKYAKSGVASLVDISVRTRGEYATRTGLFRWALFNALIGNSDAHLKNISLFAGKAGYTLAPHYDLLSTAAWSVPDLVGQGEATWPNVSMSFVLGAASTYAQLSQDQLSEFGKQLGVAPNTVSRERKRMVDAILREAKKLLEEFDARSDVPSVQRASHMLMLRRIVHMCISETSQKLRQ